MIAVLENIERVLKSKRKDKHARYVALDIVKQELRKVKGQNTTPRVGTNYTLPTQRPYRHQIAAGKSTIYDVNQIPVRDRRIIEKYVMDGKKLQAIKELRQLTGIGLREAKDTVELHPSLVRLTPR